MARRWKARSSTPGDRNFKAGSLGFAPAVADVKTTAHIGDGTAGSLDLALYALITGIVAAADVRNGTARYSGGSNGTCYVPAAGDVQFGVNVDATTGTFTSPAVGKVISDTSWGAGGTEFTGTYQAVVASAVQKGVAVGVSPAVGTLVGIVDSGGVQHNSGVCDSMQAWAATGIVDDFAIKHISGIWDGASYSATTGLSVGQVLSAVMLWNDGDGMHAGTYVAPVQAGYSALAAGYGPGGGTAGTLAASKIHDGTYGTLADGSVLVAAGGSYVDPSNAEVKLGTAIGVSPRAGTWDAVSKTDVVAASWVVTGYSNYVGGDAGTYPTTATSQASQLATDQAAVLAAAENIDGGTIILGQEGTGVNATTVRTALGLASANLDTQLALRTGFKLAADGVDLVLIDGKTLPAAVQIVAAAVAGKVSGAGTTTEVFKALSGTDTRITATVDSSGNRTSVVYT